jgi:hypothetical protein
MLSCVSATIDPGNVCQSTIAFQTCVPGPNNNPCIPGTNAILAETPQQLNEYTLASVDPVEGLTNFNVNYNVSNVDQVYLPVAMEPMVFADRSQNNATNTPGYLGTTLEVKVVRKRLMDFTGATGDVHDPRNPKNWPIYTVQKTDRELTYPMAGIRVPGANNVFIFLAQPTSKTLIPSPKCAAPECIPTMSNGPVWSGTTIVDGMISQWMTCTLFPTTENCPQSGLYSVVNSTFQTNYGQYYAKCGSSFPAWIAPVTNNPPLPNLYAFLQYVYGWVPFNVSCGGIDLPIGTIPMQYIRLSDNFQMVRGTPPAMGQAIFNPYAQLIHGAPDGTPKVHFGLDAAAYAYSIDDGSSFLSKPGVGLIFAVGGEMGLPNPTQFIFPPPLDPTTDIQVILGATTPLNRPAWVAYDLCVDQTLPPAAPSRAFMVPSPTDADGGQRFYVPTDVPTIWRDPCYLTISDAANKVYQIEVLKTLPWTEFNPLGNGTGFDLTVMACPTPKVPPNYTAVMGTQTTTPPIDRNNWCGAANEIANPALRFELDLPTSNP